MIIVEGPDGAGKTTLAKLLSEAMGIPYLRYSGLSSTTGPDDGIVEWWDRHLVNETMAVFDRCFYISEAIYQPVTPGRPLTVDGFKMSQSIHDLLLTRPLIIFCLPEWEKVKPVVMSDRDRLQGVEEEALEKVNWVYHSWYAHFSYWLDTTLEYDWTADNRDQQIAELRPHVSDYVRRRLTSAH